MNAKLFKRAAAGVVALTMLSVILPADSDLTGLFDGAALTASAADASSIFGEPTAGSGYALESETYTLTDDINTSSYIHVANGVTAEIDLNGHTIDRGLTVFANDGNVIKVDEGGTLTITDSSEDRTGTIKGGYTYDGAGIYNEGTCTVHYITITGNTAVTDSTGNYYGCGGGVCNNGGELSLNDCTITGNKAAAGGGVYVYPYPTDEITYLSNVTITSNTATGNGGGINNHGNLSVRDCTIQNNSSGNNGGGMYFDAPGKDILLFSENTITENTALKGKAIYIHKSGSTKIADVLIADGCDIMENLCPFTAEGEISPESDIAVYIPNGFDGAVAYGYANANRDLDPAEVFRSVGNYSASFTIDEYGHAHAKHSGFEYIDRSWDSVQKKVVEELKTVPAASYRFPESVNNTDGGDFIDLGSPNGEWYVVDHDITVNNIVRCFGSPHILLCDGATLTCNKGIVVENDNSIHIYGQSSNSGTLITKGTDNNAGIGSIDADDATNDNITGTINIYGGTISAKGSGSASGIGGGAKKDSGYINIYGGNITAKGGGGGSGIGTGQYSHKQIGKVTIYGGDISAVGGYYMYIHKAQTKLTTEYAGACIGEGSKSDYCYVEINGGNVTAESGDRLSSGIGAGGITNDNPLNPQTINGNWNIVITGGTVIAKGGANGAGIGGGCRAYGGSVTITGGNINAQGYRAVGNGNGYSYDHQSQMILGDTLKVTASGDSGGKTADTLYPSEQRAFIAMNRKIAIIQECTHGEITYTVSGDGTQHISHCSYCNTTHAEEHIINSSGYCEKCGFYEGVPTYTVTLSMKNENGSTIEKSGGEVVSGQTYALPGCDSIPANHRFTGWTMGDDTELRQPGEEITVTGNMTLTANYVEQCKVTFSFGEEEGFSYDHLVDKGTAIEYFGDPEAEGYIFKGWYLGETLYDFNTLVTSDITLTAHWEKSKSYINGASLTLNGGISVNVYIQPFSVDPDTAYVTVKGPDDSDPVRYDLKDLEIVVGEGYKLTYDLTAQQMGEEIEVHLYDTFEGESYEDPLFSSDLTTEYENGFTFGPKDYFAVVKGDDRYSEKLKKLCSAMERYGEYAREYFGNKYDPVCSLADDEATPAVTAADINAPWDEESGLSLTESEGIFVGTTLSLKSETTLSFYFQFADKDKARDLSIDAPNCKIEVENTDKYTIVRVRGINAKDLNDSITLQWRDGLVIYSPMNYCYEAVSSSTSKAKLKNVCKALYLYWQAAQAYF